MKLPTNTLAQTIPLELIFETGNVRDDYDQEKIIELAKSIHKNGLLNPLTVKKTEKADEHGNVLYELVCGHRRLRAYKYLVSQKEDYNQVPVCIKRGDKDILQLIENIQRENLTPSETEKAVIKMLESGMSQIDVATELSKSATWVNDILAGNRVRETAESAGIETDDISTRALSQFRTLKNPAEAVQELKERGGTYKEATNIKNEHKAPEDMHKIFVYKLKDLINSNIILCSYCSRNKCEHQILETTIFCSNFEEKGDQQ